MFTDIKLSQGLQQLGGMGEEEDIRRSKTFFLEICTSFVSPLPLPGESLVQWAAAAAIPAAFYPHIPLRRALTSAARGAAGESGGELSGGAGWTEWRIQHTALLHLLVPVASMQARELSQFLPMLLPSPSQN